MTYEDTGLPPGNKLYRKAFVTGVRALAGKPDSKERMETAVRIAQLMTRAWSQTHPQSINFENMVAAVLAGPAVFAQEPTTALGPGPISKAWEVLSAQHEGTMDSLMRVAPKLSPEARLFLQASAIIMLEKFFEGKIHIPKENEFKLFVTTLQTFTAVSLDRDEFGLKPIFESLYRRGREHISFKSDGDKVELDTNKLDAFEKIFQVV